MLAECRKFCIDLASGLVCSPGKWESGQSTSSVALFPLFFCDSGDRKGPTVSVRLGPQDADEIR